MSTMYCNSLGEMSFQDIGTDAFRDWEDGRPGVPQGHLGAGPRRRWELPSRISVLSFHKLDDLSDLRYVR